MSATSSGPISGEIEHHATYTLPEFRSRTKMGRHAMRAARRAGLRVVYAHGRAFVRGADWHAYLESLTDGDQSPPLECSASTAAAPPT